MVVFRSDKKGPVSLFMIVVKKSWEKIPNIKTTKITVRYDGDKHLRVTSSKLRSWPRMEYRKSKRACTLTQTVPTLWPQNL